MKKEEIIQSIEASTKRKKADIVFKNAQIVDVFNSEIISGDVAVTNGRIVGIGDYEGNEEIDISGKYLCPGLIDGHVHIESSMVPPHEFAKVVLPHGVTTVIADPHEIANVSGVKGIQYMLDSSEGILLDVFVMLPSSVPATSFEHAGARLEAVDLEPLFDHERVIGLAEVMDYVAVQTASDSMLNKLEMTARHSRLIDGHMAGLPADLINVYRSAGIMTDHEVTNAAEAKERVQRGMYVLIRQGSVAKDLPNVIEAVNERNSRRFLFCTDDKHLDDLAAEGSIDHNIRLAVQYGVDPITAIQMATLNAAECYELKNKGAVAPGYEADLLILNSLSDFQIEQVYKAGKLAALEGGVKTDDQRTVKTPSALLNTVHLHDLQLSDLKLAISNDQPVPIIEIIPNQLVTRKLYEQTSVSDGIFHPTTELDHLKLIMAERHKNTGLVGKGIVKGFQLKRGAIATSISHDSHNLIAAGTNDSDLLLAVKALKTNQGGLAVVQDGNILAQLPLSISGLISDQPYEEVLHGLKSIHEALEKVGLPDTFNPFLTLSFLGLPVIPELKITCQGIFDVHSFKHLVY
ncbi:adenine deaminase [Bacillus sp. CMF21]|uniref:adenine deaminase n=1 Tax=Metabacillus dongyingensis TaxID=2874282 RepID=UPI001CC16D4B|nr:adenine deaminase [Metabacillus dongyingensis]UAL54063.1 adenine deaminase [Metabacillus dongyingensis]USK30381.1 adenine deaminase [Bacillus sp. CMF21]